MNTVGAGGPDIGPFVFWAGSNSSYPVVGDWNGDGIDTPAYRVGQNWTVRTESVTGGPTESFVFGVGSSIPSLGSRPLTRSVGPTQCIMLSSCMML